MRSPLVPAFCGWLIPLILLTVAPALPAADDIDQPSWSHAMLAARAGYVEQQETTNPAAARKLKPLVTPSMAGTAAARAISIDVTGAPSMQLISIVDNGGGNCHIWGDATLTAKDGMQTRLGDLKPVAIQLGWGALLVDKNWQDNPLKIGQQTFEHGVWVHGNSNVTYRLDGKYERFEAKVGLDADRATGNAHFEVRFQRKSDMPRTLWQGIAAEYPTEAAWFEKHGGKEYLSWFDTSSNTSLERSMLGRALNVLGPRSTLLRAQLNDLAKANTPGDDPRWLNLFALACRAGEVSAPIDAIWIVELRQRLNERVERLLGESISSNDPRWNDLSALLGRIDQSLPPGDALDIEALGRVVDVLGKTLPDRFGDARSLAQSRDEQLPRWRAAFAAAASGDASAIESLGKTAEEILAFRRTLVSQMRGVQGASNVAVDDDLEGEWQQQHRSLKRDLANRGRFDQVADQTYRREALILPEDRDPADVVLRRAAALLADLKPIADIATLTRCEKDLRDLTAVAGVIPPEETETRYVLFTAACRVRREIALSNPLLDFDQILFIKRHRALMNHMCDQYYGMAATPGGGLYVLSDPFGPSRRVRDVLADSVVQRGRLKGTKLDGGPTTPPSVRFDGQGNRSGEEDTGGTFLSPDLSYDGRRITFAYVENTDDRRHRRHTDPSKGHWHEGRCYHVFKVHADGTGLEQLTDGTFNDFDPCWLPNGRIAFISERRGGYLRCGRTCPTYTLYDMADDGSAINCLSFHETNEWHPSVNNKGLIVWTRWDYVDRHGCTAHMPWVTTVDGRDPRPVHGNYAPRPLRPDMEVDCRSIPGSDKYIATAAPHHGQAFGSLILIDPNTPDDDLMGPVRRLTPEVGFPETQGGSQVYGTPWALSDDYYLCVYDASMQPGAGRQGRGFMPGNYGIYLVDAFGNKELIYRDPEIGCLSPIPLRARRRPHFSPDLAGRGPETDPSVRAATPPADEPAEGTLAVVNVYKSFRPWPEETRITALRVYQLLPMSVPSGGPPHETGLRIATAGDSVVTCRQVLGTVPVESDGSAHFTAPANCELFFQALDAEGLAVQSMRSGTQLHRGERLVCAGCHEPKGQATVPETNVPLAMRRPPSRLVADVDGSAPFSYPRLVQPVLDRKCVGCHEDNKDKAPNLAREPITRKWYASFNSLAPEFGFHDYGDAYRTTPGNFGARASKLYSLLKQGHHDVELTQEEWHRLTLWLDTASMFYGVYEREGGEAQLRGEIARPTLE